MRATLVVARGRSVYLVTGPSAPREFPRGTGRADPSEARGPTGTPELPRALLRALDEVDPAVPIVVCGQALHAEIASQLSRPVRRADALAWHGALRAVPLPEPVAEREHLLARARAELEASLRSPEEILVTLAREEERLERSVGREERAAEAFVVVPGTVLVEHARAWGRTRGLLTQHHRELVRRLEVEARRTLPNLSAVVGARTAARLAAAAGGVAPLARMSSSRLQLLGSRRRPSAERGPRYGAIYLADGADEVPSDRRAAFARSIAALAAIAVRADVLTHGDIASGLVRRRDARRDQLRRRRG